jgi:hypothetical protein
VSIKTNFELPKNDIESDLETQAQRLARDLSKNFKSVKKQLRQVADTNITINNLGGVEFSQSWSSAIGLYLNSFTFTHNLGVVPSKWLIIDSTVTNVTAGGVYSIWRSSWTSTQITITISVDTNIVTSTSGTFKILVLE